MSLGKSSDIAYTPVTGPVPQSRKKNEYIPFTLRSVTLLAFAVLCCAGIGGLEYMARANQLRNYSLSDTLGVAMPSIPTTGLLEKLEKRQETGTPAPPPADAAPVPTEPPADAPPVDVPVTTAEPPAQSAPPKDVFNEGPIVIDEPTPPIASSAPAKTNFNDGDIVVDGPTATETPTLAMPAPTNFDNGDVQIQTTFEIYSTPAPKSAFVTNVVEDAPPSAFVTGVDVPKATPTKTAFVDIGAIAAPVVKTRADGVVETAAPAAGLAGAGVVMTTRTNAAGAVETVAAMTTSTAADGSVATVPVLSAGIGLITTVQRNAAGVPTATLTGFLTTLSAAGAQVTGTGSTAPPPSSRFLYGVNRYILGQYLLTLLAVALSFLWRIIDTDIKRMSPWYALSSPDGLAGRHLVADSLLVSNAYAAPIVAAYRGDWTAAIAAAIYCPGLVLVQLLAPLAVFLAAEGTCGAYDANRNCTVRLAKRSSAIRILQGLLGLIVLLVLALIALQFRMRTRLSAEPHSIVGLAAVATDPRALPTFANIDAGCSSAELAKKIAGERFRLAPRPAPDGTEKLVLESYGGPPDMSEKPLDSAGLTRRPRVSRPLMLRTSILAAFMAIVLGALVLILLYRFGTLHQLDRWMASQSVGVRLFVTALALALRSLWEPVEREVRLLDPFRRLAARHQPPVVACADYSRSLPLVTEAQAAWNGDWYVAWVGTVGLLVEVLVVVVAGVPYTSTLMFRDYQICTFLSAAILLLLLGTLGWIWVRRGKPCLPRQPYSVAGLLSFVVASRMGEVLSALGVAEMGTRRRNKAVKTGMGTVGFGWTRGVDGVVRVGVDVEELEGGYEY